MCMLLLRAVCGLSGPTAASLIPDTLALLRSRSGGRLPREAWDLLLFVADSDAAEELTLLEMESAGIEWKRSTVTWNVRLRNRVRWGDRKSTRLNSSH